MSRVIGESVRYAELTNYRRADKELKESLVTLGQISSRDMSRLAPRSVNEVVEGDIARDNDKSNIVVYRR